MAIERLKLAVFLIKLFERTSRDLPAMTSLDRYDLLQIKDQKTIKEDYILIKDPGTELKQMSIDVHSMPACFDKVWIILNSMWRSTGIPLTYVIRKQIKPESFRRNLRFGQVGSQYCSIDKEMVT